MKIIKFGIIGTCGFLTEAIILTTIQIISPEALAYARIFSFPPAVCLTWLLNRIWTFKSRGSKKEELSKYTCTQIVGAGINFVIYYLLLENIIFFSKKPILALAVASLLVMFLNYFSGLFFVFKTETYK